MTTISIQRLRRGRAHCCRELRFDFGHERRRVEREDGVFEWRPCARGCVERRDELAVARFEIRATEQRAVAHPTTDDDDRRLLGGPRCRRDDERVSTLRLDEDRRALAIKELESAA